MRTATTPTPATIATARPAVLALATGLALALAALAQAQPASRLPPRIGYVYPAGGRQGTTFTVTVGGQNLADAGGVDLDGAGITAKVTGYQRPLNQKEVQELKEEADQLREKFKATRGEGLVVAGASMESKPVWTPDDTRRAAELRKKLAYRVNRQAAPAIAEAVTLEVTVAPDAEPGEREIRLRTPRGLSNPLVFWVGRLPELTKPPADPNTAPDEGRDREPRNARKSTEQRIALPALANGQIMPGEVDRYRFTARRGQRLVVAVSARALIPYLADAVPGWFQAALALSDARGHELASAGEFRFDPDPVLAYEIPSDGEYVLTIRDSIYRGRQDFVYRFSIGELPFVTGIFPLGGPAGTRTSVSVWGWNLPTDKAVAEGQGRTPGVSLLSILRGELRSNEVPFALDTGPESVEVEPNDDAEHAQKITPPVIVNGRIDRPGDWDVFRFEGRAGAEIVAEVFARRLNSPLDSVLKLTDAAGRQLAFNDDYEDKGEGLTTHHADSRISFRLPADGIYYLHVGDAQQQGGPEFAYRLHVGPPRPDFALRVVPSTINVRSGTAVPVTVYVLRKDGFDGEINLELQDAARAFGLSGARIPAGQDRVRLTISTTAAPRDEPYSVRMFGRATIRGRTEVHEAVPAEDMMQAFAYHHLVPAKELKVLIFGGGGAARAAFRILGRTPVRIPAGGTARFTVEVRVGHFFDNIQVELSEPPDGITLRAAPSPGGVFEVVLAADAAKVKPGLQGNLILMTLGERTGGPTEKTRQQPKLRVPLSALPALPFEIVAR